MRSAILLALSLSACVFEAPPAVIADAGVEQDASVESKDAEPGMISRVQSGTVSLANADVVDLSIDPVALERSVLWFNLAIDSAEPRTGHVRGQLAAPGTIHFARAAANDTGSIVWYLTEFGPEVSVQRGTLTLPNDGADTLRVPIDPIDLGRSFLLISVAKEGANYDDADYFRAALVSETEFEISTVGDSLDGVVDWQVITMTRASVKSGATVLEADAYAATVAMPELDASRSFLVSTWDVEGGSSLIGPHVMRAGFLDDAVTFNRTINSGRMTVSWSVVSLLDGSRVQGGLAKLTPTITTTTATLAPVNPSLSIAIFSSNQRFGASSHMGDALAGDDNVGAATFSGELRDPDRLVIERGVALGHGRPWWTVIEFEP